MLAAPSHNIRALVFLCALLCGPHVYADDTIEIAGSGDARLLANAENLLAAGQSEAAYEQLKAREQALAGNVLYDYLLGVAALDSGLHSDAIFSLRRAIAVAPDFAGARMELARAYFESGNRAMARPLFVNLLDEQPPPAVRSVIDNYIAAIDARPVRSVSRFVPYIELGAGHDTNANGSTDNASFLGFTLTPDNVETESAFATVGAGFAYNKASSNRYNWYTGGHARYRKNPDASFVDSVAVSGFGGLNWQRDDLFGRVGVDAWWANRDGDPNSSYGGIDALIGKRIADAWELAFGLRGGALRHDDDIDVLDVDRFLYVAGLNYRFGSVSSFRIELIGGSDDEKEAGSPYGNSKLGGRIALYMPIGQSGQMLLSTGSLTSDYDGLFFGAPREDTQISSILQVEFRDVLTEGLSLIPSVRHIDNDSDVALYKYDRTEFGLLMRWTPQ